MFQTKVPAIWFLKTSVRWINHGYSIVPTKSGSGIQKNKGILKMAVKRKSLRSKKKKTIVKNTADDIEGVWLENLKLDNLKLYRKTSFGSFRKINIEKLLEKLQNLQLRKEKSLGTKTLLDTPVDQPESKNLIEDKNQLAVPFMSEFLIQNLTSFPLLKVQVQEPLSNVLKEEKEEFGAVDVVKFPSVTKILGETMSETNRLRLRQWKLKMVDKLGEEGFHKQQQEKVYMKSPTKSKQIVVDMLRRGAKLHLCLKKYLESGDAKAVDLDPHIEGCWSSLKTLLPEISNVLMVEESLYHPVLMYRGIVDCVASYRNVPCVIEWKKSDRKKTDLSETYDAPLQLCAYLGALAWHKKLDKTNLKSGLVVVAYTNGEPANVFSMDLECCQFYWSEWLRRLQNYWVSKTPTSIKQEAEV